jgi:GGDEF domain-containing protein
MKLAKYATTCEGAMALAEKLRETIEAHSFSAAGKRTSSFGVASYMQGDDTKTIVGRADEALYRVKEGWSKQS